MRRFLLALPMLLVSTYVQTHWSALATAGMEGQAIRCTPEREGRFVEGSSGAWLNVPFTGALTKRNAEGQTTPVIQATISIASEPCPRGKPHALRLDSAGHFDEKFDLETDTHLFCRGGKIETEKRVIPIRLRLTSPGCDDLEVVFSGEPRPYALRLACAVDVAGRQLNPNVADLSARVGARVELSDGVLTVNGARVILPVEVTFLERELGAPSEVVRAAGDRYSNDVYEWESSGVFGFAEPNGSSVHALGFLLAPDLNNRHWCDPGTVQLIVNAVEITSASRSSEITAARFQKDELHFALRFNDMYATLLSAGEPPVYYELEIGTQ